MYCAPDVAFYESYAMQLSHSFVGGDEQAVSKIYLPVVKVVKIQSDQLMTGLDSLDFEFFFGSPWCVLDRGRVLQNQLLTLSNLA